MEKLSKEKKIFLIYSVMNVMMIGSVLKSTENLYIIIGLFGSYFVYIFSWMIYNWVHLAFKD